jgi:hypothetical protein
MDVPKTQGDICRVKLIIAMPTIRSVLLLIDCLTQTANLINGEFNHRGTIVDKRQSNNSS